jgi:hypothetical protein
MPLQTYDIEFTKDGDPFQPAAIDTMLGGLAGITDLFVLSHGWNNDKQEAETLYSELLGNIDKLLNLRGTSGLPDSLKPVIDALNGRNFAAVRVFWPSKRFADSDLIPGGGAVSVAADAENDKAVLNVLDRLAEDPQRLGGTEKNAKYQAAVDQAKKLVPDLATVEAKQQFITLIRGILDPGSKESEDASSGFFDAKAETLFENAATPVMAPGGTGGGGSASIGDGSAASLGDMLSGVKAAARRIANFATYYQMKARAGTVGSTGLANVLKRIRQAQPTIRIHLIGHSFGGRVVTAAANAFPPNTQSVTMSLLQAAFSHNGLSGGYGDQNEKGFFRPLIDEKRISGPIIITHTKNDKAVGVAYPLASRIAGQNAAALGDQNDPYGGMGRNGAQNTAEADNVSIMGLPGTKYSFKAGKVHNILADVIQDHSDVRRIEVAYAVLANTAAVI